MLRSLFFYTFQFLVNFDADTNLDITNLEIIQEGRGHEFLILGMLMIDQGLMPKKWSSYVTFLPKNIFHIFS